MPIVEQMFQPKEALDDERVKAVRKAITTVSETERLVDRQTAWSSLKGNPFSIAREATLLPVFQAGHLDGVRLGTITPNGILQESGFKPDDVVRAINGKPITDPVAMLQVPISLQQQDEIRVQIDRQGQAVTLTFHLR